ncbi:SCO family protein [Kallotenue papyrolyticum]|uniref:SCO family protein n=1 Tax=Kallotenue papyrolyticum TaxID=1325125 RepID=UPI0004924BA3|nr:SCO family protein [Kallotenue papyrolyticum]
MKRFLALLLTLLALMACGGPHRFTGTLLDPPEPIADWTLTDQHGQPFRLSDQRGKLVLLYFGYTNCPDFCPITMGIWKQVRAHLGADAEQVRFVMISTDPARDTPEVLARYLSAFDPAFVGLQPTPEQLDALSRKFGAGVDANAQAHGDHHAGLDPRLHGTYTYVLDRQGRWRLLFPYDTPVEAMVADLRALLREGAGS